MGILLRLHHQRHTTTQGLRKRRALPTTWLMDTSRPRKPTSPFVRVSTLERVQRRCKVAGAESTPRRCTCALSAYNPDTQPRIAKILPRLRRKDTPGRGKGKGPRRDMVKARRAGVIERLLKLRPRSETRYRIWMSQLFRRPFLSVKFCAQKRVWLRRIAALRPLALQLRRCLC